MAQQLEEMDPTYSIRDLDKPSQMYQKYTMKDENTGLLGLRLMEEKMKIDMRVQDHKKVLKVETKKKDAVTRRMGKQDNAESTSLKQTFKMEKDVKEMSDTDIQMLPGSEVAIIGFWKRGDSDDASSEW